MSEPATIMAQRLDIKLENEETNEKVKLNGQQMKN